MEVIDAGGRLAGGVEAGDGAVGGAGGLGISLSAIRDATKLPTLQIFRSNKKETKKVLEQVVSKHCFAVFFVIVCLTSQDTLNHIHQ